MKKILLSLGLVGTTIAPVASLVSCSDDAKGYSIDNKHTALLTTVSSILSQPLSYIARENSQTPNLTDFVLKDVNLKSFSKTSNSVYEFVYNGENPFLLSGTESIKKDNKVKLVITNSKPTAQDGYHPNNFNNTGIDEVLKTELYIDGKKLDYKTYFLKMARDTSDSLMSLSNIYKILSTQSAHGWSVEVINKLTTVFVSFSGNGIHAIGKSAKTEENKLTTAKEIDDLVHEFAKLSVTHIKTQTKEMFALTGAVTGKYLGAGTTKVSNQNISKSAINTLLPTLTEDEISKITYVLYVGTSTSSELIGAKFSSSDDKVIINLNATLSIQ